MYITTKKLWEPFDFPYTPDAKIFQPFMAHKIDFDFVTLNKDAEKLYSALELERMPFSSFWLGFLVLSHLCI